MNMAFSHHENGNNDVQIRLRKMYLWYFMMTIPALSLSTHISRLLFNDNPPILPTLMC
jgi:hypothetical protein